MSADCGRCEPVALVERVQFTAEHQPEVFTQVAKWLDDWQGPGVVVRDVGVVECRDGWKLTLYLEPA